MSCRAGNRSKPIPARTPDPASGQCGCALPRAPGGYHDRRGSSSGPRCLTALSRGAGHADRRGNACRDDSGTLADAAFRVKRLRVSVTLTITLIDRLNAELPDKHVLCPDVVICPCSTMYRV